jgi:hypothetical protein
MISPLRAGRISPQIDAGGSRRGPDRGLKRSGTDQDHADAVRLHAAHPPDSLPILFLLPFGLADLSGYWTALVAAVISYPFFGLDAIADELQAFADTPMIVPLDAPARALEIGILEMLGQKQLPPPMQPKNFVLT